MKNTDDVVITFGFGSTVHDNKSGNVHLIFNDTKCSVSHVTVYLLCVASAAFLQFQKIVAEEKKHK